MQNNLPEMWVRKRLYRSIAAMGFMLLIAGPAYPGVLVAQQVVDGWIVPCNGVVHTSMPITLGAQNAYIKQAYSHVEALPDTAYNLWIVSGGVSFGVMNEYIPSGGLMEWRTARSIYSPDWIFVPVGVTIAVQAVCDRGPFINTLVLVWYTVGGP